MAKGVGWQTLTKTSFPCFHLPPTQHFHYHLTYVYLNRGSLRLRNVGEVQIRCISPLSYCLPTGSALSVCKQVVVYLRIEELEALFCTPRFFLLLLFLLFISYFSHLFLLHSHSLSLFSRLDFTHRHSHFFFLFYIHCIDIHTAAGQQSPTFTPLPTQKNA